MDQQRQSEILKFDQKYAKGIRRRFSRIGFALTIMMLAGNAASTLIHSLMLKYAPDITATNWYMWTLSAVCMYFISFPLFLLCVGKDKTAAAPEQHKLRARDFAVLTLMSFGVMYIGNYIGTYLMMIVGSMRGEAVVNPIQEVVLNSNMWLNVVVTVIIAPIVEEMIFRKIMIDRLGGFGEKTAIIFSALMFGLFHGNLYQFFYAFGVGLLLAYVYVRTGKVWHTVLLHMVMNLFGGVVSALILRLVDQERLMELLELMSDAEKMQAIMADVEANAEFVRHFAPALPGFLLYSAYAMALFGVSIAGAILLLVRRRRFIMRPAPFEMPRERIGYTVYFSPGVIAAILVSIALMLLMIVK